MNVYRLQVLAEVPRGWSRDDLLAHVVAGVSAVTLVERATTMSLVRGGTQKVSVVFAGLNDEEAQETARRVTSGLPAASDALLDRKVGRKYKRVHPASARLMMDPSERKPTMDTVFPSSQPTPEEYDDFFRWVPEDEYEASSDDVALILVDADLRDQYYADCLPATSPAPPDGAYVVHMSDEGTLRAFDYGRDEAAAATEIQSYLEG